MDGVTNWNLPIRRDIKDIYSGSIFSAATTNIERINDVRYGGEINNGPYVEVTHNNNLFDLSTIDAFRDYEEYETNDVMTVIVDFQCTGSSTVTLILSIGIQDTNNNAPEFRPTDVYDFSIATPIPPGFHITGCVNDITVRDIDLTTQRIHFDIEDNEYFEIAYDDTATNVPKEFKAVLRTKTLIRALPEVVELEIYATDVDLTGDPNITTTAIVRIEGDAGFEMPIEPIFSQPYYLASYTTSHEIVLEQLISLQQGYHKDVTFTLEGEYRDNFQLVNGGNEMRLTVTTPLSDEVLRDQRIILVVRAVREDTSGATAAIFVQLPEVLGLEFSQPQYSGSIVDNVLQSLSLTLTQGYQDGVNVTILGDHSSFFSSTIQGSMITLAMSNLDESIIAENNFITLQVIASNDYSSASAIVTLGIIKDDINSPAFEKAIYSGTFDMVTGLTLEQIVLVQGYDDSVQFELSGEHSDHFEVERNGRYINLVASKLPVEVLIQQHLLLTIIATKPRTLDATAIISVTLPEARELRFGAPTYSGTLQDNVVTLENIILSVGYEDGVSFALAGEYASSFAAVPTENEVAITLRTSLPDNVVNENSIIMLTLTASGVHAVTTSTSVVLEIIKPDITTPVFSQNIYRAEYLGDSNIDMRDTYITLIQGYDSDVEFRLDGEHSEYFDINDSNETNIILHLKSAIPEEIIYQEKVLIFNILAEKALTVGANAAVSIEFSRELTEATLMKFAQQTYIGTFEGDTLRLENIVLETGIAPGTRFTLLGELSSYFTTTYTNNEVTVSLNTSTSLPTEVLQNDTLILLKLEAERERAVTAVTSIVIEILREDIIVPQFTNAYYRGSYTENEVLIFEDIISLSQGHDETVTFKLEGDSSEWFDVVPQLDSVNLILTSPIPANVLEQNSQLLFTVVAIKPGTIDGRAAISIDLPKDTLDPIILSFAHKSYVGRIENGELDISTIVLNPDKINASLNITGEYASYFELLRNNSNFVVQLIEELPPNVIEENSFIVLDVTASYAGAIPGYTTLVIEIVKTQIVQPIFEHAYYIGEYSVQDGLSFEHTIRLIQGFDESVNFTLAGDDAQWFELVDNGNTVTLRLSDDTIKDVKDRSHVIFRVVATKTNSVPGEAAIIISLTDFYTTSTLVFSQNYYMGSVENGILNTDQIILMEGYTSDIQATLLGDHAEYFQVTHENEIITLHLISDLPPDVIDFNNLLVFNLEVETERERARAIVILEVIKPDIIPIAFDEDFYVGSYTETDFIFEPQITLATGYDETVLFFLDGDHSQWFDFIRDGNSVSLILKTPVPPAIVASNRKLIFVIRADKPDSTRATATIVISLMDDPETEDGVSFENILYKGVIEDGIVQHERITVLGYDGTEIQILGDHGSLFEASVSEDNVIVKGVELANLPLDVSFVVLELRINEAGAVLLLNVKQETPPENVSFDKTLYEGIIQAGVVEHEIITVNGYSGSSVNISGDTPPENVSFDKILYEGTIQDGVVKHETIMVKGYSGSRIPLSGEHAEFFNATLSSGTITVQGVTLDALPSDVQFVLIEMSAGDARAMLVLTTNIHDPPLPGSASFDKTLYEGTIREGIVQHETITVLDYIGTAVEVIGDHAELFKPTLSNGIVTLQEDGLEALPDDVFFVSLEMKVSTASAILVLAVTRTDPPPCIVSFEKILYEGNVHDGAVLHEDITVNGYSGTDIQLLGDYADLFKATLSNGIVTVQEDGLEALPSDVLFVSLEMRVSTASAILVLAVTRTDLPSCIVSFEKTLYEGLIQDGAMLHEYITVNGYSGTDIQLLGEFSGLFEGTLSNGTVTVRGVSLETLPPDVLFVALEMKVSDAGAVLLLTRTDPPPESISFDKTLYEGTIKDGVVLHESISINGYNGTSIEISGEHADLFSATLSSGTVTIQGMRLDALPSDVEFVLIEMSVGDARAMLILTTNMRDPPPPGSARFDKALYEGTIREGVIQHETITVLDYTGTGIEIIGDHARLFNVTLSNGIVTIQEGGLEALPSDVFFVSLEMRVSTASAVLVLTVHRTVYPELPTITFSSESYAIRVDVAHTGLAGRVHATADNREAVTYSLNINDPHLQQRLSIDIQGGLFLSAQANSGVYNFQVVATTVVSQATATAQITLTVDAITICGEDDLVVPPLIILDRDEEEPHRNLVLLNEAQFPGCRYTLTNLWPHDQKWLYVDDNGLHSHNIDREDESIAFMALSQVQVELFLECDTDKVSTRHKRSLNPQPKLDHLGPYDYGDKKWILTDGIRYNSRRTLVNLIVNDINDNAPIFDENENEPIVVGYPVPKLEERVLPRALVELQATDADVGMNARLFYWSLEDALSVAPSTGLVHVRKNELLEDNMVLTVNVTDRNGDNGLTGSVKLMVKLIDTNHIAVVTVRDKFLNDERNILTKFTEALGYEVKSLRSTVVPHTTEEFPEDNTMNKRERISAPGASLQLYIYGLYEREPVDVDKLLANISSRPITVNIIRSVSLEEYLEGLESCVIQSATGLLVATIILSVLLFIIIVAAAVWFFLRRKWNMFYKQFSDIDSLASHKESGIESPKPEDILARPRIDLETLKKSEKRLQEMLDTSVEAVAVEPTPSDSRIKSSERILEAVVNDIPIVIQSIDKLKDGDDDSEDEDEFGERRRTRKKSVVTFNENVEKIIHVENIPDDNNSFNDDIEVFNL
ncbi:uncharacterized protein LOC113236766 [Hyposmocoma kahamanoa]|uniref:uncharacterized protein LOC113236766 n=1 Tax=Hyposmocoma kahamanoa TaxID=1477025 RepID=UPI000E6D84D3|nr:uncharacterized protein LOC113236766 [Hyposmocoma kahamanoa]